MRVVQIVENWTDVDGRVTARHEADVAGFECVDLEIERVAEVPGFPNLFREPVGSTIHVGVAAATMTRTSLEIGAVVTMRIRMGGPAKWFAHPDLIRVR